MSKPRIYVETTIPSFYHDHRDSPAVVSRRIATRRWWDGAAARYELVTSEVVRGELAAGTADAVGSRLALIAPLTLLTTGEEVASVTEVYIRHKLMPANTPEDAIHLALASLHDCDFIVTWNCRHLANPNKAVHIQRINRMLGLTVPRLVTPLELLKGEASE
jgi:predicted nucleic acid-binding protein